MHSKKLLSLFTTLICMVTAIGAFAQNVTVRGTVKDAAGPVVGAVVLSGGANAVTDLDGNYSITVPSNAVLEVSCLGYQPQNINVNGRTVIDIVLEEDAMLLQEAVALGYGVQTKRKDLSASVGIVDNVNTLAKRPTANTTALLQGQIPGVTVTNPNGDPNSGPGIVIRGQGSRNGDSVLWVVDGVPGNPLPNVNEIESIVVLKDAASAAIYGATSGAGGVILVTTKNANQGIHVEYNVVSGFRQATNLIRPLNAEEEIEMQKISYANAGLSLPTGWDTTKNPWVATTRTNFMDEVFRNAFYQRHDITLNYGSDAIKSRLTFSFNDNNGVVVNTFNKSYNVNYRGEYNLNKWLQITERMNYSGGWGRSADFGSAYSGILVSAIYMPSSAEAIATSGPYEGWWGGVTTEDPAYAAQYGSLYGDIHGDVINPLYMLHGSDQINRNNSFTSSTGLNITPMRGLRISSNFIINENFYFNKNFSQKNPAIGKPDLSNGLSYSAGRGFSWRSENTITYDRTFGKHTIGALAAVTANKSISRSMSASRSTFATDEVLVPEYQQYFAFGDANTTNVSDGYGTDANMALVARASYSFDDRYFVTASWRRDYAGRLPKTNNYGDFPAVTGAWKISNEPFFPKNDVMNFLKLRASWGRVGNLGSIPGAYRDYSLSRNTTQDTAIWNMETGVSVPYRYLYYPWDSINPYLTWETSEQWDLGVDMEFLRSRLAVSADYYRKRTFNLIQSQSTNWPETIGRGAPLVNQGEIANRGFEIMATWRDRIGKDFSYYISGNYSFNHNEVISTGFVDDDGNPGIWYGGGTWRMLTNYIYQSEQGQPLNSYYMIKSDGIFQSWEDVYDHQKDGKLIQANARPGDLRFVDLNDDGKIDDGDRQYLGSGTPNHTFALSYGLTWKNLSFDMMWQGVAGNKIAYVGKQMILTNVEGNFNRAADILNAWSEKNPHTSIPILSKNDPNNNIGTPSSWYLEDGSYVRLKNITLGYDLTSLMRRLPHFADRNSSCSVYVTGENLLTLTKYSGMDPECGGYDTLKYPVSKVFAFGLKLNY